VWVRAARAGAWATSSSLGQAEAHGHVVPRGPQQAEASGRRWARRAAPGQAGRGRQAAAVAARARAQRKRVQCWPGVCASGRRAGRPGGGRDSAGARWAARCRGGAAHARLERAVRKRARQVSGAAAAARQACAEAGHVQALVAQASACARASEVALACRKEE
jgi:hypothetical protein